MNNQNLQIEVSIQVLRPASEVFEAIVDPQKMSNYFISKSSGRMEDGKDLTWLFPEFEEETIVKVGQTDRNRYIPFYWEIEGKEHLVEINLSSTDNNNTVVKVTEKGGTNDEKGIIWLKGNTEGWANFLACLKAYLEYDINLRKGAFDFLRKTNNP